MEAEQCRVPGLDGRVALVTGAGRGIGAAVAEGLAASGARVALHCHGSLEAANALAARIGGRGGEAAVIQRDLTERGAADALVEEAVGRLGGLDILVNNAGAMVDRRPLEAVDDAFIDAVLDLNVRPVIHACRAAVPALSRGGGSIINVSSISARTGGSPGSSVYSSAKAFISTFTRSLAKELAEEGIRVNAVSPGTVETDFHRRYSTPEKLERTRQSIPLRRLAAADDCVGTFLYLASESLSGYITGQVVEVNGGQLIA
ncbi:SDR family oxidoreductase [Ectothiorhodospiraceae bacterium WFHF3C12]|nr:SDR family oxidoreductase [Ectothiorhodospiraceae bacterium WFHF3C12]